MTVNNIFVYKNQEWIKVGARQKILVQNLTRVHGHLTIKKENNTIKIMNYLESKWCRILKGLFKLLIVLTSVNYAIITQTWASSKNDFVRAKPFQRKVSWCLDAVYIAPPPIASVYVYWLGPKPPKLKVYRVWMCVELSAINCFYELEHF